VPVSAKIYRATIGVALLLVGIGLAVAWWTVRPAPPKRIVLSAGAAGGAYLAFAQRYADVLARDGVTVDIRASPGSVENLRRLRLPQSDPQAADVAFLQSGTVPETERAGVIGLGSLYYEPAWLFMRRDLGDVQVTGLAGRRISVGPQGSGSRALALSVLRVAAIEQTGLKLLSLEPEAAAAALRRGEIDGAFLVAKIDSPVVRALMSAPEVHVVSWQRAEALQRRLPDVTKVTVPAGVLDLQAGVPQSDIVTIAARATLAAREDLHPAIIYLLVKAAKEIHGGPALLNAAREFPNVRGIAEVDVPEDVEQLYQSGPPFLYRYLPYWLANLLIRLWVLAIPLAAVSAAASSWLPRLLTLRPSMRVETLYRRAKAAEAKVALTGPRADATTLIAEIDEIIAQADSLKVPASMLKPHYELRGRVRLIRSDMEDARARLLSLGEDRSSVAAAPAQGIAIGR
jgi:TRAP transporter TAXI family solute receptor